MFGTYHCPFSLKKDGFALEARQDHGGVVYTRLSGNETIQKRISGAPHFVLHPIEPLQLPKPLAQALAIQFEESLVLGPLNETLVFLSFPLEYGVFLNTRGQPYLFDAFTLAHPKLTLYGKGPNGALCRYHKSPLYNEEPTLDPLRYGVLRLKIRNSLSRWVSIQQSVLGGHGMKLAFKDGFVGMVATMKILNKNAAEVECSEKKYADDMNVALETIPLKLLSTQSRIFSMDGFL